MAALRQHGPVDWGLSQKAVQGLAVRPTPLAGEPMNRSRRSSLSVVRWLMAAWPVAASSQPVPTATIPLAPACVSCRIVVAPGIILGDTSGPGEFPRGGRSITRDDRGRYFVGFLSQFPPKVYGPDGRYQAELGRAGEGPGEFRLAAIYAVGGDTAWISDSFNGRLAEMVYSEGRWAHLASRPVSGIPLSPFSVIRLRDRAILYNGVIMTSERIGYPLHLFRDRQPLISFGTSAPAFRPAQVGLAVRAIWPARDGGAWVAHSVRYEVERYDDKGGLRDRWERRVPWFFPHDGSRGPDPGRPPDPRMLAIGEDDSGLLWFFLGVPDPRSREAFGPAPGPGMVDLRDFNRYYDTLIEVFDPRRGVILASQRVDDAMVVAVGAFRGGFQAASELRTESGGWRFRLWGLRLSGVP